MKLEIQVIKQWCHPHFGGDKRTVNTFTDLKRAEQHYKKEKENDCDFQHTSIQLLEKYDE